MKSLAAVLLCMIVAGCGNSFCDYGRPEWKAKILQDEDGNKYVVTDGSGCGFRVYRDGK